MCFECVKIIEMYFYKRLIRYVNYISVELFFKRGMNMALKRSGLAEAISSGESRGLFPSLNPKIGG